MCKACLPYLFIPYCAAARIPTLLIATASFVSMVPAMQLPMRTENPDKERINGDGMNRLGMTDSVTQASAMGEEDAGLYPGHVYLGWRR